MDPKNLIKLNDARQRRQAVVLLTDVTDGRDRVILEGDAVAGALGEAIEKSFRTGKSEMVTIEGRDMFLNVHVPSPRIIAIGAVHITQALAKIASVSGCELTVIDPRTAFATKERFEGVPVIADWPQDVLAEQKLDPYCAVVAVTHDPKIDDFPINEALKAQCFYVGALGSRKTHASRIERLKEAGLDDALIERIHAPIGLDIGAANPQEIAVAIMAEIIESFRKRGLPDTMADGV